MGNPLYRDYDKLVNITVLGEAFQVPENNTCLRAFQYMSPETIFLRAFLLEPRVPVLPDILHAGE